MSLTVSELGAASRMLRDALKEGRVQTTWIYFVQAGGEGGPIKIGTATDVAERVRGIQVGNHEPVWLLAVDRGTQFDEEELHLRYSQHWIRGEWFRPSPELLEEIAALAEFYEDDIAAMRPKRRKLR